jgi:hypothetical protein
MNIVKFPLIPDAVLEHLAEEYLREFANIKEKTLTFESYAMIRFLEDHVEVFLKLR